MPKFSRDMFRRGVRMQHHFEELKDRNDPLGHETFNASFPERLDQHSSPPLQVQDKGERFYTEPRSAVVKPSGQCASLNGPAPDLAQIFGNPIGVGTKSRSFPKVGRKP